MNAITTLNEIRKHDPCSSGWSTLLRGLGKTAADDEPLPLARILEINGISDAIWAIRAVPGHERSARLFACDCAESVLHLFEERFPGDKRPRTAIEVARRFANGAATDAELREAADAAARAAAVAARAADAAYAAADAAYAAARAAVAAADAAYAAAAAAADAADAADADAAVARAAADATYYAYYASARSARTELFKKHFCQPE